MYFSIDSFFGRTVRGAVYLSLLLFCVPIAAAQDPPTEGDYYRIETLPIPEDIVLEVGGMAQMPDGRLAVSSRRGDVWLIQNPTMEGGRPPYYHRFARGLHEPLGLAYRDGALYAAQRGELTRMRDEDGDGRADVYESVYSWPLAGNYHEYSYGPLFRDDGSMLVTLNLAWIGHGASLAKWRGWMLQITQDGEMTPVATGMRSPAGFGHGPDGSVFYAENQGDWIGSGYITHVEIGDFLGNPEGLRWTNERDVPARLSGLAYDDVPDNGEPLFEAIEEVPSLKRPTVWFPHTLLGISTSDILVDSTGGAFGPFEGQLLVGDQGHSRINRVALEKVNGVYQGVVIPFREGFQSGVLRLTWGVDGSLFVGQTSRGWSSTGRDPYGIQRVVWTGETPFEVATVEARPDGFELGFTLPVDSATASDPSSYDVTSFIYKYHHSYGSPPIQQENLNVRAVSVAEDGLSARLAVEGLRKSFIHEIKMEGVRSREDLPLLHDVGYYTLNEIPGGPPMDSAAGAAPSARPTIERERRAEIEARPKRLTEMPASWTDGPDVTVTIGTEPGLRYDVGSFDVRAGSRVRLDFENDDDMMHNLVVVMPRTADAIAQEAIALGLDGHEMNYVPESDDVLFHTRLLEPNASEPIYFVAPVEPGEYTFVCTFPGHARTMRGIMRVVGAGD
ncbi:MAG: sulfocyanin-like copper-binding protein [Rhodothermales bacterium]